MFIIDGVYRNVDISGLSAPILEGTVLTETGAIASADGSDAFGIVPQTIYEIPPTKLASVVVGGTIDLRSPANANVEFSEAVMKALGADINFVQNSEAAEGGGGGSALPVYSPSDIGKVLTLGEGSETVQTVIVPEQTVTLSEDDGPALLTNVNEQAFQNLSPGETANAVINGVSYVATSIDLEGTVAYGVSLDEESALFIAYSDDAGGVVLAGETPGTYTISLSASVAEPEPKWEAVEGIQIIRPLKIKDLPPVPDGWTPNSDYDFQNPESDAIVAFSHSDLYDSDLEYVAVENSNSNVMLKPSFIYVNIGHDPSIENYAYAPTTVKEESDLRTPAIDSGENNDKCYITANVLPLTVEVNGPVGPYVAIDTSSLRWVRVATIK